MYWVADCQTWPVLFLMVTDKVKGCPAATVAGGFQLIQVAVGVGVGGVGVTPQSALVVQELVQEEVVLDVETHELPEQPRWLPEAEPPLQEPSHWVVSPVVQALPSLQESPVLRTQVVQVLGLVVQEFVQAEEVLDVETHEVPSHARWVPETGL